MLQGEISILPLPDLIEWLAVTQQTGKLVMDLADRSFEIYFIKGEIAGASLNDITVLDHLEQIQHCLRLALERRSGRFEFYQEMLAVWVTLSNMHISAEALLHNLLDQFEHAQPVKKRTDNWIEPPQPTSFLALTEALRLEVVNELMQENYSVPAMPQVATRVIELTSDVNFSMRALGNLIMTDQAVTARVLRYANSALHSKEREIDSLPMAIQRLGTDEVVNIVLAAALQARRQGRDLFVKERRQLWVHSTAAAFIARSIAGKQRLDRNLAFLSGLLMDFGMAVLYSVIQDVLSKRFSSTGVPSNVVQEIIRDCHPRVGRTVGENWKLPKVVVEVMADHHNLKELPSVKPYVAIAALADALATYALSQTRADLRSALLAFSPERLLTHPAAQLLDISSSNASAILTELPANLDHAYSFVAD